MSCTVLQVFSGDLWAGAEVMVYHLIERLSSGPALRIVALVLNEGVLAEKLRGLGVEVVVVSERSVPFPAIVRKAYRELRGRQIEIVHSHRYKENLLGFFLGKLFGAKCLVATMHGLPEPSKDGSAGGGRASLTVKADQFLLRAAFRRVVVVSEDMKRVLAGAGRLPADRLTVIHNGIPLPASPGGEERREDRPLHVGTVGRFVAVKDHALFLETAALIARRNQRVRFSLLGDGPLRECLRERAQALGIAQLVEFHEPVLDPTPFYRSLDLYLNTSLREGIPLSILEAMACGRAVVAPRVGGIPEIVTGDAEGLLVASRRPEDFAAACLGLLADPARRSAMGRAARERVRTAFSDGAMAEKYAALYDACLGVKVR
jgi:glycosyltransferase involved in cell wall biosynthesis